MSSQPRTGITILVETGLADIALPEIPKLQLEVDEHHHHKDVYEHSITVLEQAIAQTVRHEFIENHEGEELYFSE
jgi:poly(A) polymerase